MKHGNEIKKNGRKSVVSEDSGLAVNIREKLHILVIEFGMACEKRKMKNKSSQSIIMRRSRNRGLGSNKTVLDGETLAGIGGKVPLYVCYMVGGEGQSSG